MQILWTHLQEGIGIALDRRGRRIFVTDLAGTVYGAGLDGSRLKEISSPAGQPDRDRVCRAARRAAGVMKSANTECAGRTNRGLPARRVDSPHASTPPLAVSRPGRHHEGSGSDADPRPGHVIDVDAKFN